jgi:4-diphosphocytidyl-2-C-methyl-D-erythritol kinase
VSELVARAKINLALVVGPLGAGGKHEVTTVLQRVELADRIVLEPAPALAIEGFDDDTLVAGALRLLGEAADAAPRWAVRIEKRIPVAAGLGGGSSDAAAALRLANATLERPLPADELAALAAGLGADVPFFLAEGPQLGEGDGSTLSPLDLPQCYSALLVLPEGVAKSSTASVYASFDERQGAEGYAHRRAALLGALAALREPCDLAALPANDLVSSPVADELRDLGAFRAEVSGAGPAVYGLFDDEDRARSALEAASRRGRAWLVPPAW